MIGTNADAVIYHTIRFADGTWVPAFGNVNAQERNGSQLRFVDVICATIGEDLHVVTSGEDGRIYHTIRFANGTWIPSFGDVSAQEHNGSSLSFIFVSCASIGNDLHVVASDEKGRIYHTIRFANGTWVPNFGNVNDQEHNGNQLRFVNVSCAAIGSNLHIVANDENTGIIYHTIRFADGTWVPNFGNVNAQEHNSSLIFNRVSAAAII